MSTRRSSWGVREWIVGKEGIFREDLLSTDERDERQRSPQSSAWRPWRAAPWTERNRGNTGTFVASIDQIWCRVRRSFGRNQLLIEYWFQEMGLMVVIATFQGSRLVIVLCEAT